ncbi:hypothetical protein O9G_006238 [Rozella allomycis CSF55]|uniref:Uncharacterized protein n=1 Tax=Rozella allomycis (strain CSF55) TaxID=988480 RepID=A0A075ARG6_ROZAC|nr:hypothetical protein O9G_006238 [Rozella allomycis CSF55]|eukprot:EPZ31082.1 hypothetical protein O9G_006238 [Rozella allomycis CSF55]
MTCFIEDNHVHILEKVVDEDSIIFVTRLRFSSPVSDVERLEVGKGNRLCLLTIQVLQEGSLRIEMIEGRP